MSYMYLTLALLFSMGVSAKKLTVMQYNVENLFDTKFDEGTVDYTYLPLSVKRAMPDHAEKCEAMGKPYSITCLNLDWNDKILGKKIANISKVIKTVNPDIIVMEEVENINVVNELVNRGLSGMGYDYRLVIEGDDTRGIDVGILSKFPITSSKHYSIFYKGKKLDTRGITEAVLNVDGKTVVVTANHWPSQNNPVQHRVESAKVLQQISDAKKADLIIAVGDFNTIAEDSPYPFSYIPRFTDSEHEARPGRQDLNPGTHYYRGEWSSLDKIFIHKNSVLKADYSSFNIIHESFMMTADRSTGEMVPKRFDTRTGEGFSDHLPLILSFQY